MKFAPQNFYIAVLDLLAILIPGLAITFALQHHLEPALQRVGFGYGVRNSEYWPVFFAVSYVAGHMIAAVGRFLDLLLFDRLRKATPWQQTQRHAIGKMPSLLITRALARLAFGKNPDLPLTHVLEFKKRSVPDSHGQVVVNAYEWCKARLVLAYPAAFAAVQRLEIDAKLFRGVSMVCLFLLALHLWRALRGWTDLAATAVVLLLLAVSLWRFVDRRFRAMQQAYWFLITLESSARADESAKN